MEMTWLWSRRLKRISWLGSTIERVVCFTLKIGLSRSGTL